MTKLFKLEPESLLHRKNFFWFDETGRLYYGPDASNLHFPQMEEAQGRFHICIKDLEEAFKLGTKSREES